jgi:CPA2 family monovalent cation:H+ antiporter-2
MMAPWDRAIPTIGVAIGLVAVKAVILFPIALLMGLPKTAAGELAIVLGPGGEFALILIGDAVAANHNSGGLRELPADQRR